jgi:hypothetical protein
MRYPRTYANLCHGSEKFFKKLVGRRDIEDALRRLDRLTQEETLMAAAQILNLTHAVNNKLKDVDDKVNVVVKGMPRVGHSFIQS